MKISGSTFKNNKATQNGGAVDISSKLASISDNTVFESNKATNGGSIYSSKPLTLSSTTFKNNTATINGGAIYSTNTITINISIFTNNSANNGSAIYNTGKLTITTVNFSNNCAKTYNINLPLIKVQYTDYISIDSYLIVGDNVINSIYNKGNVTINGVKPYQSDRPYGQNISLKLNGMTYKATTNSSGIATFKIPTINNFLLKNYDSVINYVNTGLFSSINKSSSINITKKETISTSSNNKILSKTLQHYKNSWIKISKIGSKPEGKYRTAIKHKLTKIKTNTTFIATNSNVKNSTSTKNKKEKNKLTITKTIITASKLGNITTKKTTIKTTIIENITKYEKINIYLHLTKDCKYKDPKIIALAKKLTKNKKSNLEKANAILYWVNTNIIYKGNQPKSASKTLATKKSNCVGIAHITVALFRASGLSTRYQAKFYYDPKMYKTHSTNDGAHVGHVWAQVYLNGKWRSADLWPIETKSNWDYIKLSKNYAIGYISAWESNTFWEWRCNGKTGKNHKFSYLHLKTRG
ncbi:transglutaminase-like superfamily protein [Methanobrevibacter curvatus]|uniref:Transglutaminase-like superfamily protein n=1 Tax=Methanobrevibacter curvatus TaxID=49547 RepID=A0A165ZJP3_9EURY|nr:transglutaminase-like superfamily protein [Methanobrevibacter curvatus]